MTSDYARADTDWFADCRYGITFHWTAQTIPRHGPPLPFEEAVDSFRLDTFMAAIDASGADYVIFTVAHGLQKLPCPHPVLDSILPGRTTQRDLLGEIADELHRRGKHFIAYYNHSCNQEEDPQWKDAVGYRTPSDGRLAENLMEIVRWMGERYGERMAAWWFDSPYSLDPRGPNNTVTTDMTDYSFPWESFTEAAKAGHSHRPVTYCAGIDQSFLYTTHQDYWAGELSGLHRWSGAPPELPCAKVSAAAAGGVEYVCKPVERMHTAPRSQYVDGLLWHGWTCLDDRNWVQTKPDTQPEHLRYGDLELIDYLCICRQHRVPMSFNVAIFQDGSVWEPAVSQLGRVGRQLTTDVRRRARTT